MAEIANKGKVLKHLTLTIGTDSYSGHVSSAQLTPSSGTVEWRGGTPEAVLTDTTAATWTFVLAVLQDYTAGSLFRYLLEHEGETATVTFKPNADDDFTEYFQATIAAPAVGGAVNQYNESQVTLGVQGKPSTTAPVQG